MIVVDVCELRPKINILQFEEFLHNWQTLLGVALNICLDVVSDQLPKFIRNFILVGEFCFLLGLPPLFVQRKHLDALLQVVRQFDHL